MPITDTTREKLTQDEFEFHQQYHDKGITIVPPARAFKNGNYNYAERAERFKSLTPELCLLVTTANKLDMCIFADGFIFAPPQTKEELKQNIETAIRAILEKAIESSN